MPYLDSLHSGDKIPSFSHRVLEWYDEHQRELPWRTSAPDPYKVWISEIMLQQTTVTTVIPYFLRFMERFPTVSSLAMASLDEVFIVWQGLGYYRRATFLHTCAQIIAQEGFPLSQEGWLKLPGIGPYTSAAIAAIALNQPAVAVDGNIYRVFSRHQGLDGPTWKKQVEHKASEVLPPSRWGDYTQGLMDIGALICRPQNPQCSLCPLREDCYAAHHADKSLPPKVRKKRPTRYGAVFVLTDEDGRVFVTQEAPHGLLKGLWGFPTTSWDTESKEYALQGVELKGHIHHIFTHFHLRLAVLQGTSECEVPSKGAWIFPHELSRYPLSRLMRKVQQLASFD